MMRNRAKSSTCRPRVLVAGAALALAAAMAAPSAPAQNPFSNPERRAERQEKRAQRQGERETGVEAPAKPAANSAAVAPELSAEAAKYTQAGPYSVASWTEEWTDAKRDGRVVPVKIYMPDCCEGTKHPVILVSHGLGGSREGLSFLGNHFSSHGFVAVHMQHAGSDTAVIREAMATGDLKTGMGKAITPKSFMDRSGDPPFVLDELARANAAGEGKLAGRLDLERVGVAGHSYGAGTSLTMAGQRFGPRGMSFADARIKAAAPLSPPPPRDRSDLAKTFGAIGIPLFMMTGTLDDSPVDDSKAIERRAAFEHVAGIDAYLVTLDGGDHMVFSGERRPGASWGKGDPAKDADFHPLILAGTLAFFQAYLNGDAEAKAWLSDGGYAAAVGAHGVFEKKSAGDAPAVTAATSEAAQDSAPPRRGLFRRR